MSILNQPQPACAGRTRKRDRRSRQLCPWPRRPAAALGRRGDLPTPDFINRAAMASLSAGETFYTWQRGIPELRQALSDYYSRHFGVSLPMEHFYATGSGMQAIQLSVQAITSPGDEMIYLSPAWPNIAAALEIAGARSIGVPLQFENGRWTLDLERLKAAITPKTKGLFINTPSNSDRLDGDARGSGRTSWRWLASMAFGSWPTRSTHFIITPAAGHPHFLDVKEADDRIIVRQFLLEELVDDRLAGRLDRGARRAWPGNRKPGAVLDLRRGAVHAGGRRCRVDEGDDFLRANIAKAARSRDILCDALIATNRVHTLKPDGALYSFLKIDGVTDSRRASPRYRRQDRRRLWRRNSLRQRRRSSSCAPVSCAILRRWRMPLSG